VDIALLQRGSQKVTTNVQHVVNMLSHHFSCTFDVPLATGIQDPPVYLLGLVHVIHDEGRGKVHICALSVSESDNGPQQRRAPCWLIDGQVEVLVEPEHGHGVSWRGQ
jgi:hypothetical protein